MLKMVYTINLDDALKIYETNYDFRKILQSGSFLYAENCYVLNTPRYVLENEFGKHELTEYARNNLSECAIAFDGRIIYKSSGSATRGDTTGSTKVEKRLVTEYSADKQKVVLFEAAQEAKEAFQIAEKLPRAFGPALVSLMKWRKTTNEKLAETTLMSSKTIQRMRGKTDESHETGTVIAICVGLQLFPRLSRDMLSKAGIALKETERDYLYSLIIDTLYKSTVEECNRLLIAANHPPLTRAESA